MASRNTDYVFGRKMDRKQIATIYFRNKKENIGEDAWDVSEQQNGSVMAWIKWEFTGASLYIAANGPVTANRNCSCLFYGYENLLNIFHLRFLQTDRTENMSHMFGKCSSLITLDLSSFDTSWVEDMGYMFAECENLKTLDLGHFDTSHVTSLDALFCNCKSLENLDLSSFDTRKTEIMRHMFSGCDSLKTLDISSFDLNQIHKYGSDSFMDKTGLSDLQQVNVKQPANLWPSVVRELAELGESCYQLEQAKMDIRACKRHGIPSSEREAQWFQKAAASGEKEAQLQLSVYYNNISVHFRYGEVRHGTLDGSALFWKERAWTRYLTPRNVSYPQEFNYFYPEDSLTADQEYIIAVDYDLRIRSEAQKMHSKAADCLNEEEFIKLKGMAERSRETWLRKAAEHGSKEAQYYLGILLYSVSQEEGLDWLNKSQTQGYEPAKTVLSRRAESIPKPGLFEKIFSKKFSEKSEIPLELDQAQNPEFLGFSRLAKEGELEAKLFLAREYEKTGLWDQAFPLYIQVAWSGNPSVMEIVSRCYAEGKGTEKDLAAASFWYERALRRGTPTMEDPAKNLDEKEKRELLSSRQKHILRLDAEVERHEKARK
jgi:surface protein